jgi:hypothetical protein
MVQYLISTRRNEQNWTRYDLPEGSRVLDLKKMIEDLEEISIGNALRVLNPLYPNLPV